LGGGGVGEEKKNKKQMLAFLTSIELEEEGFQCLPDIYLALHLQR
jgi:hypothetical protein